MPGKTYDATSVDQYYLMHDGSAYTMEETSGIWSATITMPANGTATLHLADPLDGTNAPNIATAALDGDGSEAKVTFNFDGTNLTYTVPEPEKELILYYDFSSTDGSSVDNLAGDGNDAALINDAAITDGVLDLSNNGWAASAKGLSLPVEVFKDLQDVTIVMDVKLLDEDNWMCLLNAGIDQSNYMTFTNKNDNTANQGKNSLSNAVKLDGGTEERISAPEGVRPVLNQWTRIALRHASDGTAEIYMNDICVASGTLNTTLQKLAALDSCLIRIGSNNVWNDPGLNGYADNVRVYNYVLTEEEMAKLPDWAVDPVAEIVGGRGYASLEQALAAAESDDTVKLLTSLYVGDLTIDKDITLDLNGQTLYLNGTKGLTVTGAVKIKNGFVWKTAGTHFDYVISNKLGALTLDGVAISVVNSTATDRVRSSGTLVIQQTDATEVQSCIEGNLNITGGTVAIMVTGTDFDKPTVTGGISVAEDIALEIRGGKYSSENAEVVADHLAAGLQLNSDYVVERKAVYVAQIGSDKYESLEDAVAAATATSNPIELLMDVELQETLVIDKSHIVGLALCGHTLSAPEGVSPAIQLKNGMLSVYGDTYLAGTISSYGDAIHVGDPETLATTTPRLTVNSHNTITTTNGSGIVVYEGAFTAGSASSAGVTIEAGGEGSSAVRAAYDPTRETQPDVTLNLGSYSVYKTTGAYTSTILVSPNSYVQLDGWDTVTATGSVSYALNVEGGTLSLYQGENSFTGTAGAMHIYSGATVQMSENTNYNRHQKFYAPEGVSPISATGNVTAFLDCGYYSPAMLDESLIKDGYRLRDDGYIEQIPYVAQNMGTGVKYESLEAAIADAGDSFPNDIVDILTDISCQGFTVSKSVTLSFAGHSLNLTPSAEGKGIVVPEGVNFCLANCDLHLSGSWNKFTSAIENNGILNLNFGNVSCINDASATDAMLVNNGHMNIAVNGSQTISAWMHNDNSSKVALKVNSGFVTIEPFDTYESLEYPNVTGSIQVAEGANLTIHSGQYDQDMTAYLSAGLLCAQSGSKWAVQEAYIVHFEPNNGATPYNVTVAKGDAVAEPEDPTRTGYNFTGWFTDSSCTEAYNFPTVLTDNLNLYAGWALNSYTVTFDTGVDGITLDPQTVDHGGSATKPADPVREGYKFGGWYEDEDLMYGFDFENDSITADTTLYAKWIRYVAYIGDVGYESLVDALEKVGDGGTIVLKEDTTETEYYESNNADNQTLDLNGKTANFSNTFIAVIKTLTVTGDGKIQGNSTLFSAPFQNSKLIIENGTFTSTNGPVVYGSAEIKGGTLTATEVIQLEAAANSVTISGDAEINGKLKVTAGSMTITGGTFSSLSGSEVTDPGSLSISGGWFKDADSQNFARNYIADGYMMTADGHVVEATYTVTFNSNGGSSVASQTVKQGLKATEPTTAPTKSGYAFAGWYADEALNTKFDFNTSIYAETTLYAKWLTLQSIVLGACSPSGGVITRYNVYFLTGGEQVASADLNAVNTRIENLVPEVEYTLRMERRSLSAMSYAEPADILFTVNESGKITVVNANGEKYDLINGGSYLRVYPKPIVAKIGTVEYYDLQAAVDKAKDGETITVLGASLDKTVVFNRPDATITMAGNNGAGFTIQNADDFTGSLFKVENGNLIFNMGVYGTNAALNSVNLYAAGNIFEVSDGELTISGSKGELVSTASNALYVTGGKVTATGQITLQSNGTALRSMRRNTAALL